MEHALLAWINALDLPNKTHVNDIFELYDGIILTEVLSRM